MRREYGAEIVKINGILAGQPLLLAHGLNQVLDIILAQTAVGHL